MSTVSRTKPDKTVTPIKIKNNQIISRNSGHLSTTDPNKRSLPTSPTTPTLRNISIKKPKLFNNRYNVLADHDDNGENNDVDGSPSQEPTDTTTHTSVKEILPPPIFVKGVENFTDVLTEITNLIGKNNAEFHTYQLQSEKLFRVVIRNLHPTTSVSEISSAIEEIGFATRQVTNIKHNLTKNPLPLFFVDLEPDSSNQDLFKVTSLLHTKIKVEEPHKRREIPQCLNCQSNGHTRAYCAYAPRCVKFAEYHHTSTCNKPPDTPATCALCSGNHPANYKGCTVHKELQSRRRQPSTTIKHNQHYQQHQPTPHPAQPSSSTVNHPPPNPQGRSYANVSGYKCFHTCHPDDTAHAGAAIIVRSTLKFYPLPNYQTPHIQASTISLTLNHQPITISAAYCPPRHNITPNQFNDYFNYLGSKFIIGGDINAKHTQWGCHTSNPRGNLLHRIITLQQYKILSPSSPTYWPNLPRKRPDILDIYITKISNSLNCHVTNLNEPCSDHSPVLLTTDTLPPIKPLPPSLTNGYMDWEHFQLILDKQINLKTRLKPPSDIDDAINSFTTSIQTAAWSSHLIAIKRRARAIWQRTQYLSDKRHYNNLTQKLKRTLSEIRTESFNKHLSSLTTKNNSIWKATKNILRTPQQIYVLKKPDGTRATRDEEKAEIFREHLSSTFKPHYALLSHTKVDEINTSLDSPLPMTMPPKHISPHEV
ncbi:Uncharacterized protein FWK35_00035216, partial [Aphis craccivora]